MLDFEKLLHDAENGVLPALKYLGDIYLDGLEENSIKPDLQKAVEYYERAADGGMEDALLDLGYIYCAGEYTEPDYLKGIGYYERAAALGNTIALGNLGMTYCKGYGVKKDEKKGFEYFLQSAEGGNADAMLQVSGMYRSGTGVKKDKKAAAYWKDKAEEQRKLDEEAEKTSQKSPLQDAFEKNLKFISKDTLEPDFANRLFAADGGMSQYTLGSCEFATGMLITADPLCYLQQPRSISVKEKTISPGSYPVQVSVMRSETAGLRIVGARLKIKESEAVKFELANGRIQKDGEWKTTFAGFPVECGMACFCDAQAAESYWSFLSGWYKEHENGNIYDDYFEALFAESYQKEPNYQREGGDLLMWHNPLDGSQIAMFASGLGDGYYTDYWGIDKDGEICELTVVFMNPELFGGRNLGC